MRKASLLVGLAAKARGSGPSERAAAAKINSQKQPAGG